MELHAVAIEQDSIQNICTAIVWSSIPALNLWCIVQFRLSNYKIYALSLHSYSLHECWFKLNEFGASNSSDPSQQFGQLLVVAFVSARERIRQYFLGFHAARQVRLDVFLWGIFRSVLIFPPLSRRTDFLAGAVGGRKKSRGRILPRK